MPCALPPEVLDLIVDVLSDEPPTLKTCCLVFKQWVPRARRHLFARVEFGKPRPHIQTWMKTFPDPPDSPARYARSLSIRDPTMITPDTHAWIQSFYRVTNLELVVRETVPLSLFHGLSSTLTSLSLESSNNPLSEVFDLTCSFPLLRNLSLYCFESDAHWVAPPTSPKLTGDLLLCSNPCIVQNLLNLPDGLRFSHITAHWCFVEDSQSLTDLVTRCSETLRHLAIEYVCFGTSRAPLPLDLSNAKRLETVTFWWNRNSVQWIITTFKTLRSRSLRKITIYLCTDTFASAEIADWHDLDALLVHMCSSNSTSLVITYQDLKGRDHVRTLLPGLSSGGFLRDGDDND